MMQVKVRVFAALRDALGAGEMALELPVGSRVADVLTDLEAAHPGASLAERRFSIAVNRVFVSRDHALNAGDELALIPPVSGG